MLSVNLERHCYFYKSYGRKLVAGFTIFSIHIIDGSMLCMLYVLVSVIEYITLSSTTLVEGK